MKNRGNLPVIISTILVVILISGIVTIVKHLRPELYDEINDFKSSYIIDNTVEVTLKKFDRYNNGKSGNSYYVFTDKGKLLINPDGFTFDKTLYKELKKFKNQTCTLKVEEGIFVDWQTTGLISCKQILKES